MKEQNAAMVCLSGGQDSTVCLFWAKERFESVEAVVFRYGQRHINEVEIAINIAKDAQTPCHVIDLPSFANIAPNSLTNSEVEMDKEKPVDNYPNTFVPGRNLLFLTYAAILARSRGAFNLIAGVSEADYSGYPDCRDTFVRSLNVTLNLAMDEQFIIHTPLMNRNKRAVWAMADELGVFDLVRNRTLTCYNGVVADGCGQCPSCLLRSAGLKAYLEEKNSR